MNVAKSLLKDVGHRPWEIPEHKWSYYQEWNDGLFMHWKIDPEILIPLIPKELTLQTFNDTAWVSIVAFTMQKIRPRLLPSVNFISDFHEINVRTYVTHNGKAGVYFLNIEAQKNLSVYLSKAISGMPYGKSAIMRNMETELHTYSSTNKYKGFFLNAQYSFQPQPCIPNPLDVWLVERYCVYLDHKNSLLCFDVHHKPWPLHKVTLNKLSLEYKVGDLIIKEQMPDVVQYSPGVKVLAWKPELINTI